MSFSGAFAVPADGPDAALVRVIRMARLRYSRAYVNQMILDQENPSSLLALVNVARHLGFETTAGRTDLAGLARSPMPVIVHFGGPQGEGGFGVLEVEGSDGFRVWDSVNGVRDVPRDLFASYWSGVVVLLERAEERGPRERGYISNRVKEIVFGRGERPALVGARAIEPLQAAAGSVLLALLIAAIGMAERPARLPLAIMVVLTALGLSVTVWIVALTSDQASLLKVCRRARLLDCEGVMTSLYSRVFGASLGEIGAAFYLALLLLTAVAASATGNSAVAPALGVAYLSTVPISIVLIAVQVGMRRLCMFCMAIHTINLTGAAISAWMWSSLDVRLTEAITGLGALLLLFILGLFVVIPYVTGVSRLDSQNVLLRKIQGSHFTTLAQLLVAAPIGPRGEVVGVRIFQARAGDPTHELVVFVHPSCSRCWTVLQGLGEVASTGRADIFLAVAPKPNDAPDAALCTAVVGAGLSAGPEKVLRAYEEAKAYLALPAGSEADPVAHIASALDLAPYPEDVRARAEALVTMAGGFAHAHTSATPALFLDGRAMSGPIQHLAILLSEHHGLLDPLLDTVPAAEEQREAVSVE